MERGLGLDQLLAHFAQRRRRREGERVMSRLGDGVIAVAARAVGSAVGHNPIAVLIPCHRVIRKVGEFGNYRYGELRKKALLAKEFVSIQGL